MPQFIAWIGLSNWTELGGLKLRRRGKGTDISDRTRMNTNRCFTWANWGSLVRDEQTLCTVSSWTYWQEGTFQGSSCSCAILDLYRRSSRKECMIFWGLIEVRGSRKEDLHKWCLIRALRTNRSQSCNYRGGGHFRQNPSVWNAHSQSPVLAPSLV